MEVCPGGEAERAPALQLPEGTSSPLSAARPLQTVCWAQSQAPACRLAVPASQPSPPRVPGTAQTWRGAGRATRASQKSGTRPWSQRSRRCQPGKGEAGRVPQRKQVTGSGAHGGNSGRTPSAEGLRPLPSPPPRTQQAPSSLRDSPAFALGPAAFQSPGSHCRWLLQVTLISCPRNTKSSAWHFMFIESLQPLSPERSCRHPILWAEWGVGARRAHTGLGWMAPRCL